MSDNESQVGSQPDANNSSAMSGSPAPAHSGERVSWFVYVIALREGYSPGQFAHDCLAGLTVAILALPLSIAGTFSVMYLFGFSLDNLSLMALTLCVGFVVDDAIVMLENISRHIEMGKSVMQATLDGSKEIAFTIVSMTISLAAVFIPVFFMGGILGRLLHEFAITIMAAVLVSGFVSLSLTPMLCSRWLKPHSQQRHGVLYRTSERAFDSVRDLYDFTLRWSLKHRRIVMIVFVGIFAVTAWLFNGMPKGFLPSTDTGQLLVFTEAAQDIGFDAMAEKQRVAANIVRNEHERPQRPGLHNGD